MIDGLLFGEFATGGVVAIVAIITVFVVLLAIIVLTELIGKVIEKNTGKAEETVTTAAPVADVKATYPLDINDEDAVVAALVASVDYREETHMNVRVLSIREVR